MHAPKSLLAHTFELIESDDVASVASVLESHPELIDQATFFAGGTLLHYAAAKASEDMISQLLDLGFDVNAKGKHYGDTPLHTACCNGRLGNAVVLIRRGATVNADHSYTSPLFGAILGDCVPLVDLLIQSGADPSRRYSLESGHNVDAAEFATLKGRHECADFLRGTRAAV